MTMLVLKCSNVFLPSLVSVDDLNHTFHAILTIKPIDSHALTVADHPASSAANHLQEI